MKVDKYCLVCKTILVTLDVWICDKCFRYIGKKIIRETIEECGDDGAKIPDHIPKEQHDYYFVRTLRKKKEKENVRSKKEKVII